MNHPLLEIQLKQQQADRQEEDIQLSEAQLRAEETYRDFLAIQAEGYDPVPF